uniref:Rho termination factor N-terminal domain-containing protein n=1 Tax=viral metagenome TaxID=1070528 RepID=A0A6C0AZR6_9ZZZZ
MALSDIFTMPFFFSLGITLLIVGLLGMYFIQKFQEQNHKIASMLGLVSTMAEELNFIRGRLQYGVQQGGTNNPITVVENNASMVNLIPVSDGEDDDEDDEDDDEDDEDDDDDDDDNEDEPENTIIELSNQSVKVINFGEVFDSALENHNIESLNEEDDVEEDNNNNEDDDNEDADDDEDEEDDNDEEDYNDEDDDDDIDNTNIQLLEMDVLEEFQEEEEQEKSLDVSQPVVKSINIVTLEESMIDYKKMSLQKLKSIAVSKGLIQESSKATKNAILKLLGVE